MPLTTAPLPLPPPWQCYLSMMYSRIFSVGTYVQWAIFLGRIDNTALCGLWAEFFCVRLNNEAWTDLFCAATRPLSLAFRPRLPISVFEILFLLFSTPFTRVSQNSKLMSLIFHTSLYGSVRLTHHSATCKRNENINIKEDENSSWFNYKWTDFRQGTTFFFTEINLFIHQLDDHSEYITYTPHNHQTRQSQQTHRTNLTHQIRVSVSNSI